MVKKVSPLKRAVFLSQKRSAREAEEVRFWSEQYARKANLNIKKSAGFLEDQFGYAE